MLSAKILKKLKQEGRLQPIINIEEGEKPYKIMQSKWVVDSEGPAMFKLLSKIRKDKKIEAAYVVQREGGIKTVLGRTVCEEERFKDAVKSFREVIQQFFSEDLEFELKDFSELSPSDYDTRIL